MKYLNIMSKLNYTILFFTLFLSLSSWSQKGSKSPYSIYGLGELNREGYAVFGGMGGTALGATDSAVLNSINPASYAYIGRSLPVFQLGMNGRLSQFSTQDQTTNQQHFGLNQFQLALPIKKHWGAGIGIKPYSFKGYTITNYTIEEEDTTQLAVSEGSGGVRIANLGVAYQPLDFSKTHHKLRKYKVYSADSSEKIIKVDTLKGNRISRLSIGAQANYLFGTAQKTRSNEFIPSSTSIFNARVESGIRLSGLTYEFGLNYQIGFESPSIMNVLSIGATFSPATEVRAYQDIYSYSYIGSFYRGQSVSVLDTIEFVRDNEGGIYKPQTMGVGLEYRFRPYKSSSFLRFTADARQESWSTSYTSFNESTVNGGLRDRAYVGLGLEWTPLSGTSVLDKGQFLSKLHYRFGVSYTQSEWNVAGADGNLVGIDNYGMSFGLGIPVRVNNSNTNINFAANLGNLGTTDNGLIQEQYVGLFVGLSITPLSSNRWFVKRKYN